jgi:histidinol dehydrogenase
MGVVPALAAGVDEVILASPPLADGLPDRRILAAAALAGAHRVFAIGGAQAIAALALGTPSVPRVDVVVGPGNKYVAAAKRRLFGEVGIDFVRGRPTCSWWPTRRRTPSSSPPTPGPAEHDPDARGRALVPSVDFAEKVSAAVDRRLSNLATAETARASLEAGGVLLVYASTEEAVSLADRIAPEHLELHVSRPETWVSRFRNYGSSSSASGPRKSSATIRRASTTRCRPRAAPGSRAACRFATSSRWSRPSGAAKGGVQEGAGGRHAYRAGRGARGSRGKRAARKT